MKIKLFIRKMSFKPNASFFFVFFLLNLPLDIFFHKNVWIAIDIAMLVLSYISINDSIPWDENNLKK